MYKDFFVQMNIHQKDSLLKVVSKSTCLDLEPVSLKFIFYPQTYFIKSVYLSGLPVSNHRKLDVSFYNQNNQLMTVPQSAITFSSGYGAVNLSKIYPGGDFSLCPKDLKTFVLRHNFTNQCGEKGESFEYWNRDVFSRMIGLSDVMPEPESYLSDHKPCYSEQTHYYKTHFPQSLLYQYDYHKKIKNSVYGEGLLGISGKYTRGKSLPGSLKVNLSKTNPQSGTISFWTQFSTFIPSQFPTHKNTFFSVYPFSENKEDFQLGVFSPKDHQQNWFLRYYSCDDRTYRYLDLAQTKWDTQQWVLITYTWDMSKNQYTFYLNDKCMKVCSQGPSFERLQHFKEGLFILGYGMPEGTSEMVQYDGLFWSNKIMDLSFIERYYLQCLRFKQYGTSAVAQIFNSSEIFSQ